MLDRVLAGHDRRPGCSPPFPAPSPSPLSPLAAGVVHRRLGGVPARPHEPHQQRAPAPRERGEGATSGDLLPGRPTRTCGTDGRARRRLHDAEVYRRFRSNEGIEASRPSAPPHRLIPGVAGSIVQLPRVGSSERPGQVVELQRAVRVLDVGVLLRPHRAPGGTAGSPAYCISTPVRRRRTAVSLGPGYGRKLTPSVADRPRGRRIRPDRGRSAPGRRSARDRHGRMRRPRGTDHHRGPHAWRRTGSACPSIGAHRRRTRCR